MEDIWQEAAQRDLTASPIGQPLGHWRAPAGGMDANLEDEEVIIQGEGMGTQWAATMTCRPPCTEEDVGHLLSTLAAGLRLGTQRINTLRWDATPGKTEVSFEQWYLKVTCVKDHYPESVVWNNIIRSLKGAAAHMAQYMGPTASMAHILRKLLVIFGMVASFNVLMQNVYKVMQDNNEKVPSFATKLKGTLNQIRLQCPGIMTDLEVQQHLKDSLSMESRNKYGTPSDTYTAPPEPPTHSWWLMFIRQKVRMRRSRTS